MPQAKRRRLPSVIASALLGGAALLVVAGIVKSPGEALRASLSGLQIWWEQIFPGLVPALILAELLAASGLLHGLAALAEPLARSAFRLPGSAGWAIAFGWAAGVPGGAKETARLLGGGLIRPEDTDTLLLVSHVPNPFLVVVIAGSGFLHSPALGWAMVTGLWLSAAATGIVWPRFVTRSVPPAVPVAPISFHGRIRQAVRAAVNARKSDGRPLGRQLADAVTGATGTLMTIGGLMMMASVVLRLLALAFPGSDVWLTVPGLYEMHLGVYESGRSPLLESSPEHAAALLSAALAWTGWSGLLLARAAFGTGSFPWRRVIAGKLLQAALALLFTFPLARLFSERFAGSGGTPDEAVFDAAPSGPPGWRHWPDAWLAGLSILAVFLLLALLAAVIRPNKKIPKK